MRIYVFQSGDTIWSIALKFNTTIEEIIALNPGLLDPCPPPNQIIKIPDNR